MSPFLALPALVISFGIAIALAFHGFNVITIHKHYHRKDDAN
jgi:hypothetical protein